MTVDILIEVKSRLDDKSLRAVGHRLQSIVLDRGAGLGLLIYDRREETNAIPSIPRVIVQSVESLVDLLGHSSIVDALMAMREEAINAM